MEHEDFIKKLKSGHPEAFRSLVEQYQDRVINTCYGFLKNREDAEDCAQEVFIQVYRSIASFRDESKLSTWIYRIAVSKSLDWIRKTKREKGFGRIQRILGFDISADQIPAPEQDSPEAILEEQERSRALHAAIDSLARNQRIAITLSMCEGYRYKEIAEIMGITLSSVEALIHRARKSLQKKLHDYYSDHL